jgi:dolichol-phosphate mannosyltransferase
MLSNMESFGNIAKLSVIVPCYNEEMTLEKCIERIIEISDEKLQLEIIIVDDASKDTSVIIAQKLMKKYPELSLIQQKINQGKGAALRTGFQKATGDFVAIQDADLEYNPFELKKLLVPLINNEADVVIGSRFLSAGAHRVLYFWHSIGNKLLTLISNMFTDLNLTDVESCYKVFRRGVIQDITIEENRFGFEPEIIAKVAQMRLRVFEMGISYYGRTYEEGKKIKFKDALRAMYCVFHYNGHKAPLPIQFLIYIFIGGVSALINLIVFLVLFNNGIQTNISAPIAFIIAAIFNYFLSVALLFRHKVRWNSLVELITYSIVVATIAFVDLESTKYLMFTGMSPRSSKLGATGIAFILNFLGRKFIVFPEKPSGPWKPEKING